MTTVISDLVPALQRELAVPGTFDDVFPDTTRADLIGALADGFAEAQLFGFFPSLTLTAVDDPEPGADWTITPELSTAGGALVVIYSSIRTIRAQLRNLQTSQRYKAGPVEFEVGRAVSVLTAELKFLQERLKDILANAEGRARASAGMASVFDNYVARNAERSAWGGFYAHEVGLRTAFVDWR